MKAAALTVAIILALSMPAAMAQEEQAEKPDPVQAKVGKLIEKLSSENFKEREAATEELKKIGEPALQALKKAAESEDAEVAWRAQDILKTLKKAAPDPSVRKRAPTPRRQTPRRQTLGREEKAAPRPPRDRSSTEVLPDNMKELLKKRFGEDWKEIEEMMKRLDKLERGLTEPRKWPDSLDEEDMLPEEMRKMLKEMMKKAEEARKRFEEPSRGDKAEPRTQPREEDGDEKQAKPLPAPSAGSTIVVKKLRWENGRLVEEQDYSKDAALPGLQVTEGGSILDALRYHLSLKDNEGVLVGSIEDGSPFAKAGLKKHDIITKAEDKLVDSMKTLANLVRDRDRVTLEIMRQGERKTIEVELKKEK